jgi:hypothetical protein
MGELAQFLKRGPRLLHRRRERHLGSGVTVGLGAGPGETDVVGQGQQALLGAVVEVSFEPAAFGVGLRVSRTSRAQVTLPELADHPLPAAGHLGSGHRPRAHRTCSQQWS